MTGFVPASRLYDVQTGEPANWDWNREELNPELKACSRTDFGSLERGDSE